MHSPLMTKPLTIKKNALARIFMREMMMKIIATSTDHESAERLTHKKKRENSKKIIKIMAASSTQPIG